MGGSKADPNKWAVARIRNGDMSLYEPALWYAMDPKLGKNSGLFKTWQEAMFHALVEVWKEKEGLS